MQLATRFSPRRVRRVTNQGGFLSRDDLQQRMPTVFAGKAHHSRSARYTHIPTHTLLDRFEMEGWRPTFAAQSIARDETRQGFVKHLLRFRRVDAVSSSDVPELVLLNSHDGSTTYQLLAGIFRVVCTNGLVVGRDVAEVRVPHRGNVIDAVLEGAEDLRSHFDSVMERAAGMRSLTLTPAERLAFATAATPLRFDPATTTVEPASLLRARRAADLGHDLWTTYNVVQENLIRGGITVGSAAEPVKRRRARAVAGVDQDVRLNRALWSLAAELERIRSSVGSPAFATA